MRLLVLAAIGLAVVAGSARAAGRPVGAHGLIALDWHSGNRSTLVDHELSGVVLGQTLATRAVWYDLDEAVLLAAGLSTAQVPGALHAAEHAAIGLLPLFATCDRWDIGGMSTVVHPHTGCPTVFVHDGHPGGAGFAERGHAVLIPWLTATRAAIVDCKCRAGCPSCVQSPKCGNGNAPLDKAGAVTVLGVVLESVSGRS